MREEHVDVAWGLIMRFLENHKLDALGLDLIFSRDEDSDMDIKTSWAIEVLDACPPWMTMDEWEEAIEYALDSIIRRATLVGTH